MPQANTPAQTSAAPALPDGIEIFRAGTHTDDQGVRRTFSLADLQATASRYQPAQREAPLCVGHPQHDLPAYGWVKRLSVQGDRLLMHPHQVRPQFAEAVAAKQFKKRSAAFWPPGHPSNPAPDTWYLRHVAFLGAQPPAIAGLADFAEGDSGAVCFSESGSVPEADPAIPAAGPGPANPQEPTMTTTTAAPAAAAADASAAPAAPNAETLALRQQLADVSAQLDATRREQVQFAEAQRAQQMAANVQFAEAQVSAMRVPPAERNGLVAALNALDGVAPVQFSEGDTTRTVSPATWLRGYVAAQPARVQFGEFAPGSASVAPRTDAELDAAARRHMQQHAGVSYAEALTAVTSFTS